MTQDTLVSINSRIDDTYQLLYKSLNEAEIQANKCLDESENNEYSTGVINSRILLTILEVYKGNSDLVRDRLSRLEEDMSLNSPDDSMMRLAHARGLYFMQDGVYRDSFDAFVKTGNSAARLGNKLFLALSANGKGVIKLDQQEYDDAYDYFRVARTYLHGTVSPILSTVLSLNMACALNGQNNNSEVPGILKEVLEFSRDHDAPILECSAIDELSSFLMKTGQLKEAREYLEKGLEKEHDSRYEQCMGSLSYHYTELLVREGNFDKAENLLNQQDLSTEEGVRRGDYYNLNARIYEQKGDYKNAYLSQKAHMEISNNIRGQNTVNSVYRQEKRELQEQNHRLRLISTIGQELVSNLDIGQILNLICAQMNALMPVDLLSVGVVNKEDLDVKFTILRGNQIEPFVISLSDEDSIMAWSVRNDKEVFMRDGLNEYQKYIRGIRSMSGQDDEFMQSIVCIPLRYINDIVGVLTVQCLRANAHNSQDLDNLRALASYAGIAIRNALQTEKMNELNEVLRYQSTVDSLTNLVNRREFLRQGENIWKICRRNGQWASIIMIDLDHFKNINDTFGHVAGDAVLKKIGEILNDYFKRPLDCASRYGGEELLMLAGDMGPKDAAVRIEHIREEFFHYEFESPNGKFKVNFSCGIFGEIPDLNIDMQFGKVAGLVDKYLYQAKNAGRGCTFLSDNINKPAEKFIFTHLK
jgi:diguanylate cyclase (GGDEF)-like protein